MFEEAETYCLEGIRVRIQRRSVGVVDIEFIDEPRGFPGGFTVGRTPPRPEGSPHDSLEEIRRTIRSYINESSEECH